MAMNMTRQSITRAPAAPFAGRPLRLQRKCACGASTPKGQMCEECKNKTLQTKLAIGSVDDPLEREADRVADQVMASSAPTASAGGDGAASLQAAPPSVERTLASGGRPLERALRHDMERRLGHDFSNVRVHNDSLAAESARHVNAHAYTVGPHIVFAAGQYSPGTRTGQRLLAHELAHSVQQSLNTSRGLQRQAAAPVAVTCATGAPEARKTGCIQPVAIADDDGKAPTTPTSTATAVSVWGKCCETLLVNSLKTVDKTAFKTLEESPSDTPSAQETELFNAAGSSACIQVFQPAMLKQGGTTSKDVSGGGGTYDAGTANPKIVLVEGAVPEVLAHEVGHALGYLKHDATATVMKPTGHYNVANPTAVSVDICATTRTGAALTATDPKANCCETIP
ncbi:MAG: DUF4157 domain-containing protein [Burkholderiaceae bacterium]|jgi:hypothetical protein|nr:DUF4157 domain-containing protein [Burkholderiaceae bacterium]